MKTKRIPKRFLLGQTYKITFKWGNSVIGKFIRPTKCGYNFLNEETNKCILRHHLYRSKCENHQSEDWFWINSEIKVVYEKSKI